MSIKKYISSILVLLLICTNLRGFTAPVQSPIIPKFEHLFIPPDYGRITETFISNKNTNIILIEDLHCNPNVQRNISSIISSIKNTFQNQFSIIGLEGTPNVEINTNFLGAIPVKKIKNKVVNYFVDRGYISGAELYMINNNPEHIHLFGLENSIVYDNGFMSLYRSYMYRSRLNKSITKIDQALNYVKRFLYTKPMLEIDRMKTLHKNNLINLHDYILFLKKNADQLKIPFDKQYPNLRFIIESSKLIKIINLDTVDLEIHAVIRHLNKILTPDEKREIEKYINMSIKTLAGYIHDFTIRNKIELGIDFKETKKYFNYLNYEKSIDYVQAFEELKNIEYLLKHKMSLNFNDTQDLLWCSNYFTLMKNYLNNKITHKETESWLANKDLFFEKLQKLADKMFVTNYFRQSIDLFKEALENMDGFYSVTNKRNEILVQNMQKHLLQDKGAGTQKSELGIMVAGGYHRQGITDILRSMGISYHVITPTITDIKHEDLYVRRIREQYTWFRQNNPDLFVHAAQNSLSCTAFMVISEFYKNSTEFNDQVLQTLINAFKGDMEEVQAVLKIIAEKTGKNIDVKLAKDSITINGKKYIYGEAKQLKLIEQEEKKKPEEPADNNVIEVIDPAPAKHITGQKPQKRGFLARLVKLFRPRKKKINIDKIIEKISKIPQKNKTEFANKIKSIYEDPDMSLENKIKIIEGCYLASSEGLTKTEKENLLNSIYISLIYDKDPVFQEMGFIDENLSAGINLKISDELELKSINLNNRLSTSKTEIFTDGANKFLIKKIVFNLSDKKKNLTEIKNEIKMLEKFGGKNNIINMQTALFFKKYNYTDLLKNYETGTLSTPYTGYVYIILPFYKSGDLAKKKKELDKSKDPKQIKENISKLKKYIFDTAKSLKSMHDSNYVHLDIKPKNILIGDKGQALLADFGFSQPVSNITKNMKYGTLGFQAPKNIDKNNAKKADIWALGVTIGQIFGVIKQNDNRDLLLRNGINFFLNKTNITKQNINNIDQNLYTLLTEMLNTEHTERYDIDQVLKHDFFNEVEPAKKPVFLRSAEAFLKWAEPAVNIPANTFKNIAEQVKNYVKENFKDIIYTGEKPDIVTRLENKAAAENIPELINKNKERLGEYKKGIDKLLTNRTYKITVKNIERADIITYNDVEGINSEIKHGTINSVFTSALIKILKKLQRKMSDTQFSNLLDELLLHELLETSGVTHTEVVEILTQENIINLVDNMEYLQDVKEITAKNSQEIWNRISAVEKYFENEKIPFEENEMFNMFNNLKRLYIKKEQRFKEIIISIAGVPASKIRGLLSSAEVIDKKGNLVKNTKVILVRDMAGKTYDNITDLRNIAKELETISKTSIPGSLTWILGSKALNIANENTEQGEILRELTAKGIAKPVLKLMDSRLMSSCGYLSADVLKTVKDTKGILNAGSCEDLINSIFIFRAVVFDELSKEQIDKLEQHKKLEDKANALLSAKENELKKLKIDSLTAVKLLNLSSMIYGKNGILNTTDEKGFLNVKKDYAEVRQVPLGLKITEEDNLVTKASTTEPDKIDTVITKTLIPETGFIVLDSESIKNKIKENIETGNKPLTELIEIPKQEMRMLEILNFVTTLANLTLSKAVNIDPLIDLVFGKRITDNKEREKYKAIAAAA
ncbi:protein kinase [bacterium]